MRITSIFCSSLLVAFALGCGASSEAVRNEPVDLKPTGALMAPEENGDFEELAEEVDDDDEYFGEDPILDAEEVDPVDMLEPRSDVRIDPMTPANIPAEERTEPAEIGDPRLQADPVGEEEVGKPGATTPREHP